MSGSARNRSLPRAAANDTGDGSWLPEPKPGLSNASGAAPEGTTPRCTRPAVVEPQVGLHSRASTRGKSKIPINNRIAFLAMLLAVEDFLIIQLPLSGSVRPTSARFAMVLSPTKGWPPQRNHPMSAGNVENPAGHGHHKPSTRKSWGKMSS